MRVEAAPPQKVVIDGEPAGTTPLEARVVPGALRVLVPPPPPPPAAAAPAAEAPAGAAAAGAAGVAAPAAAGGAGEREASREVEPSFEALERRRGEGGDGGEDSDGTE